MCDPETKAQVMAALLAGQGVCEVARKFNLPSGTVSKWKTKASRPVASRVLPETEAEKRDCGALVYGALESCLKAVKAIADVACEPTYIRGQSADALAVLGGVLADKGIRILEAAEAARAAAEQGGTP